MSEDNKNTEDVVSMKKADLEAVINAKVAEVEKQSKKDAEALREELTEKANETIKEELAKAEATRKSVEETGLDCFGEEVSDNARIVAKLEKSEKDSDLTDYDKELQRTSDHCAIIKAVFDKEGRKEEFKKTKTWKKFEKLVAKGNFLKAFDGGSGTGLEWEPTILSNRLVEYVEASGDFAVANLFPRVNMESKIFEIPREEGTVTATLGSVGGSTYESSTTTGKSTFTAKKLIGYTKVAYESDEDMIISAMPLIESRLVKSIARATSDAILNGDTDGTHMDADVTLSYDRRKAWDGLRKIAQTTTWTKSIGAVWTDTLMRAWIAEIATEFYAQMNDLALILPKNSYHQLRGLAEVRTVDKFASMATIVNGVLSQIDGIGVTLTSLLGLTDSSGTVSPTAANNTLDQALLVYKPAYALGMRRSMLIETDKNIRTQETDVVASIRADFQPLIKATTVTDQQSVVQAINITTI